MAVRDGARSARTRTQRSAQSHWRDAICSGRSERESRQSRRCSGLPDDDTIDRLGAVASARVENYAPDGAASCKKRGSTIRYAGYLRHAAFSVIRSIESGQRSQLDYAGERVRAAVRELWRKGFALAIRATKSTPRGVVVKLWPFSKREPEVRQSTQPFTDAIVAAIQAQATGSELAQPNATAAVESAAGFYGRAMATAIVSGAGIAASALTPSVLSLVGRDLIRRGESIFLIEFEGDRLMLRPAGSWDVRGGPRESSYWYRLDLFGPSGNETRLVPGASVLHFRYSVDPSRPWTGISPLQWARLTAAGLANLEAMVTSEAGSPFGYLLPVPSEVENDDEDDPNAALRADLAGARGENADRGRSISRRGKRGPASRGRLSQRCEIRCESSEFR